MRTGVAALLLLASASARADDQPKLAPGVRGLVTLATERIVVDGKLNEWQHSFCTPVHYNHKDLPNRAARFHYIWDQDALYIGLIALDLKQANPAPLPGIAGGGDAVELYLDTRQGEALLGKDWTTGAIHLFFTAFEGSKIRPRWVMRQGIATSSTELQGVEIAATNDSSGYRVEFKIPWANFPGFQPKPGAVLGIDAELCSGDGGARTDRTFAYGSPLSVQQPASLGKVQLVTQYDPEFLATVAASTLPLWVETPWQQADRAKARAVVAIPADLVDIVGAVDIRLHDTDGKIVKTVPAMLEPFGGSGLDFVRAVGSWPVDEFAPGTYFATARISARTDKVIATVAPRMVQEAQMSGR